jgi:hypothetical protein
MMWLIAVMLSRLMRLFSNSFLSEVWFVRTEGVRTGLCFILGKAVGELGKIRLRICVRVQGARIESVPLKELVRLSVYRKKRWSYEDGWLILEAF